MDYLDIGDTINYSKYNALVYLLRKFKRLTSNLKIASVINSDYGIYTFSGGLTSIGGNYILEDDVTITSNNCLKNCFYTFIFTAIDVNFTGEVNKREITVTGGTGENGVLDVTLESTVLESDEVLLPDFKVSIVFDPHEYYTPVDGINIEISCDKTSVDIGEQCTITAVATNVEGEPYDNISLDFRVNGVAYAETTDENGVAEHTYTGVGGIGKVTVTVLGKSVWFYDGVGLLMAEFTGETISLKRQGWSYPIFSATTDVVIDWGDDTTTVISKDNIPRWLSHTYTDGLNNHTILFNGNITSLGQSFFTDCTGLTSINLPNTITSIDRYCFYNCTGLTSVIIPNSVTILGERCFSRCSNVTSLTMGNSVISIGEECFSYLKLTSVAIPPSVTSLGNLCFYQCNNLADYQLYWTGDNIIQYNSNKMPNNANAVFTVPCGQKSNYISKGYPTAKVQERQNSLTVTADKPIIQATETSTITCKLGCGTTGISGKTLSYEIKHGNTTIDSGTDTTDSNGEIDITYTGTAVGQVDVIVSYGSLLQETYEVYDCTFVDKGTSILQDWTTYQLTSRTVDTDHIVLIDSDSTSGYEYINFNCDMIVEVDIKQVTGGTARGIMSIRNSGTALSTITHSDFGLSINEWYHLKVVFKSDGTIVWSNTENTTVKSDTFTYSSSDNYRLYIQLGGNCTELHYKNLKVYPI